MTPSRPSRLALALFNLGRHALLPVALAAALAACSSTKKPSPEVTGAIARPITEADFETAVTYWGERYAANARDRNAALNYSTALNRVGRTEQAAAVLQMAAIHNPEDREVLAAYGKAVAAEGDLPRGLELIRRAQTPDRPDWRLLSAEAAILDQLGEHGPARQLYAQAIDFAPGEPSILSNLGMSYVLTGELEAAERTLRKAAAMPNADSRVRQNLALAVGLSGRFAEAEKIASAELSPEKAAANVAYLRSMIEQQNSWEKLKTTEIAAIDTN